MKPSKHFAKIFRAIERREKGLRCDNSHKCFICKKKVRESEIKKGKYCISFGSLGDYYYHDRCLLKE